MNISAELVAIAILGVSLASLGWKVSSDIRHELKQEIHYVREEEDVAHVREDVADVRGIVADLRERMARLEGLFEGFTRGELIEEKK
jgi:ubiquinone biosynthesis protein UbiJ